MLLLFLLAGAALGQICDTCTLVNCSVSGDCPPGANITLDNMTFSTISCESSTEFDGVCRYVFTHDVGSSCAVAFPAAPDRRKECARLLDLNDEAACMVPGTTAPSCSGNTLTCSYRLLCGSEDLDNCTDADCSESCTNVETDCPLIDFNGADADLSQTYQDCIASLSPLSGNTVCSYRVSLNTSVFSCFDEGSRTSDTMNKSNIEACDEALPMQFEDCLDAVEVRCTATVFECEYQLVECDPVLDCDDCQPDECSVDADCLPLNPAGLPLTAEVVSKTCSGGGVCLYDIDFDIEDELGINCSSFVGNTAANYQILCQQLLPEFYADCKLREGSTPVCSGIIISCEYYLDCKQFAIDSCQDAGCIEAGDCFHIQQITNCPQIDFGSNTTLFDLFCSSGSGGDCVYRIIMPVPTNNCNTIYPNTAARVAACASILDNSTVTDCFTQTNAGAFCLGLTNEEVLQCRFDLDGACVSMANCSDADPDCALNCTAETECPYLDFDLNPESLASRLTCADCIGARCLYATQFLNVNCTALADTSQSQTDTLSQHQKRCGQLIPADYLGCLFVDEANLAEECTDTTLECEYRLRCDLTSLLCSGASCAVGPDVCVSGDDCLALPAAESLGATEAGRWSMTVCESNMCQYHTLHDFTNITNVTDCTDSVDMAAFCADQLADFDQSMTDLTDCLETDGEECMLTEPCLNCQYQPTDHCVDCCPQCNVSSDCLEPNLIDPDGNFVLDAKHCINFANQTCRYVYTYTNSSCTNETEAMVLCDAALLAACITTTAACETGDATCTYVANCPTTDVSSTASWSRTQFLFCVCCYSPSSLYIPWRRCMGGCVFPLRIASMVPRFCGETMSIKVMGLECTTFCLWGWAFVSTPASSAVRFSPVAGGICSAGGADSVSVSASDAENWKRDRGLVCDCVHCCASWLLIRAFSRAWNWRSFSTSSFRVLFSASTSVALQAIPASAMLMSFNCSLFIVSVACCVNLANASLVCTAFGFSAAKSISVSWFCLKFFRYSSRSFSSSAFLAVFHVSICVFISAICWPNSFRSFSRVPSLSWSWSLVACVKSSPVSVGTGTGVGVVSAMFSCNLLLEPPAKLGSVLCLIALSRSVIFS